MPLRWCHNTELKAVRRELRARSWWSYCHCIFTGQSLKTDREPGAMPQFIRIRWPEIWLPLPLFSPAGTIFLTSCRYLCLVYLWLPDKVTHSTVNWWIKMKRSYVIWGVVGRVQTWFRLNCRAGLIYYVLQCYYYGKVLWLILELARQDFFALEEITFCTGRMIQST